MKTVLITGASRGIGKAAAEIFSKNGYSVCINYLKSKQQAEELAAKLGNAMAYGADVSDEQQVKSMVQAVYDIFGNIDVVINNAGIAEQKLFTDITAEDWRHMLDVHATGTFNVCKAVLPKMISNKKGKIINISSMWGITGASCEVHYSAAKAAVIGLTKALAKEVGPSGITVNCVAPGVIATDMCACFSAQEMNALAEETPLCRIGTPEDVANIIYFLASDASDFVTGQVISPNGGFVI